MKKMMKMAAKLLALSALVTASVMIGSCDYWGEEWYKSNSGGDTGTSSSSSSSSGSSNTMAATPANLQSVPQTEVASKSFQAGNMLLVFNSSGTGGKIANANTASASYRGSNGMAGAMTARYTPGTANAMSVDTQDVWIGEFDYNGISIHVLVYQTHDNFTTQIKRDANTGAFYFISDIQATRKGFSSGLEGRWRFSSNYFAEEYDDQYFEMEFRQNGSQTYFYKEHGAALESLGWDFRDGGVWSINYDGNGIKTGEERVDDETTTAEEMQEARDLLGWRCENGVISGTLFNIADFTIAGLLSWEQLLLYDGTVITYAASLTPRTTLRNYQVL